MNATLSPTIFFAVLNMGLGHATRSLPLIRELARGKSQLLVGSSGRSLTLLQQELPDVNFIELPDYDLTYSSKGVSIFRILLKFPHLLNSIREENAITKRIVRENKIDMVISDHRYGCYTELRPSYFISHQLRFIAPPGWRWLEFAGFDFNRHFHKKYHKVIIPDVAVNGEGLLSGQLSKNASAGNYLFGGILSSVQKQSKPDEDVDVFVSVSGPEPLRTVFENRIRSQIVNVPGEKIVALGKPESNNVQVVNENLTFFDHLSRTQMAELMNRSKLIVTRSGYSTIMELAELGKKALFIPTPGQTEQQYLANRFVEKKWFNAVAQNKMNLPQDILLALKFDGFPGQFSTADSIAFILNELLKKHT